MKCNRCRYDSNKVDETQPRAMRFCNKANNEQLALCNNILCEECLCDCEHGNGILDCFNCGQSIKLIFCDFCYAVFCELNCFRFHYCPLQTDQYKPKVYKGKYVPLNLSVMTYDDYQNENPKYIVQLHEQFKQEYEERKFLYKNYDIISILDDKLKIKNLTNNRFDTEVHIQTKLMLYNACYTTEPDWSSVENMCYLKDDKVEIVKIIYFRDSSMYSINFHFFNVFKSFLFRACLPKPDYTQYIKHTKKSSDKTDMIHKQLLEKMFPEKKIEHKIVNKLDHKIINVISQVYKNKYSQAYKNKHSQVLKEGIFHSNFDGIKEQINKIYSNQLPSLIGEGGITISEFNQIVLNEYKRRNYVTIPGDGYCAVYATFVILLDLKIYVSVNTLIDIFVSLDDQKDFFLAYTIGQVCDKYSVPVVVFNLHKLRVEYRNFNHICDYQLILYHDNHFDCATKNLNYLNYQEIIDNLEKLKPMELPSVNVPPAPALPNLSNKNNNDQLMEPTEQSVAEEADTDSKPDISHLINTHRVNSDGKDWDDMVLSEDNGSIDNDEDGITYSGFGGNRDDEDDEEKDDGDDDDEDKDGDEEDEDEGDDEEDEEDEDDEEDTDDALSADEIDEEACCSWPEIICAQNIGQLADCLLQFDHKYPNSDCLLQGFKYVHKALEIIDSTVDLYNTYPVFLKNALKFRHNIFAYYFTNEIIGATVPFGTDVPVPHIVTNKTPDLILEKENKIEIIEFTVVMNPLRATFLKGMAESGKYDNERKLLEQKGFEVYYKPIFFSLSSEIEANISNWYDLGYNISDINIRFFKDYLNIFESKYNYLYTMSFSQDKFSGSEKAHDFILDKLVVEERWNYNKIVCNKHRFIIARTYLHKYDFEEGYFYKFNWIKGNRFNIRQTINSGHSYMFCKKMLEDDNLFFQQIKDDIKGKDLIYLASKYDLQLVENYKPSHGLLVPAICNDFVISKNKFTNSVFSLNEIKVEINACVKGFMNKLSTEFNFDKILSSIKNYKKQLDIYKIPKLDSKPYIVNSPRRSFIALPSYLNVIDYHLGVKLDFNLDNLRSLAAKHILSRSLEVKYFESNIVDDPQLLSNYKYAMTALYSFLSIKNLKNVKFRYIEKQLNSEDLQQFKKLKQNKMQIEKEYLKKCKRNSNNGLLKIDKTVQTLIREEMNWGPNSTYKLYMNEPQDIMNLIFKLKNFCGDPKFNFQIPSNAGDLEFFKILKQKPIKDLNDIYQKVSTSYIFNTVVFLSRLAYVLFSISNKSFNKNYVALDNLGYENCALIVKGGSKMTTTRNTKIFKLIYKCDVDLQDWNPTVISDGKTFDETNWMTLHQNMIFDLIALPYKILANIYTLSEKYDINDCLDMIMIPTLLAIHNRRKTEILFHNMRYLLVNCMGEFSQLELLIPEFAQPSYTAFDYTLKHNLSIYYPQYVLNIREWCKFGTNEIEGFKFQTVQHPYLKRNIICIDDLTYIIYSTYMMSKGAYNQTIEQVGNLKNIMETHESYMLDTHSKQANPSENVEDLINSDFAYSPKISYAVGKILSSELKSKRAANQLNINWYRTLGSSVDKMANNRGLRWKGKDFFGHKGYYVIYKHLLEYDRSKIEEIIFSEDNEVNKYKKLYDLNLSFEKEHINNPLTKVLMHVVDKSQRGGGREIFVMDYNTKLFQYPIEQMFKFICQFIDNEIITIPSSQRAGLIHHKLFEYRSEKYDTYYLTFDCRKWAPRCNPEKYLYMLLGMIDVLPLSFVNFTISYFLKHSEKEIHTRNAIVETFLKNPENQIYAKYFEKNEENESMYFQMPYSFVMGIFNMLSSLMHAGIQRLSKNEIEFYSMEKTGRTDIDIYAHSDDSAGRLSVPKQTDLTHIQKCLNIYESFQKSVNHLMSLKKCSVSKAYFELLSILYVNHELLPLLPKFLGNISLTFTGAGVSQDMKQVISKSIELQQNGATATQAYVCQIILSNMYRNFYRVEEDLKLTALGGFANCWPTLYLCYGAAVEELILSIVDKKYFLQVTNFAVKELDYESTNGTLSLKSQNVLRIPAAYQKLAKENKLPEFEYNEWFFQNNKTNHALINTYWFLAMLKSSNFGVSLLNINEVRRAYDSLYMASGKHIKGKYRLFSLKDVYLSIFETESSDNRLSDYLSITYKNLVDYLKWIGNDTSIITINKPNLTFKPCAIDLVNFPEAPVLNFNSFNLTIEMVLPQLKTWLFSNRRYGKELQLMIKYLKNLGLRLDDPVDVKNFLDFLNKSKNVSARFYARLPSDSRRLNGISGLHNLIVKNYHSCYEISSQSDVSLLVKTTKFELDKTKSDYVTMYYFYAIWKNARIFEMSELPVKIHGIGEVELNNLTELESKIDDTNSLNLMKLIEFNESRTVTLNNMNAWAIWLDRQVRIGDEWVGKGKLLFKLDNNYLLFHVRNRDVVKVTLRYKNQIKFSNNSMYFLSSIINECKFNIYHTITSNPDDLYFGLDQDGLMTVADGTTIKLGVQHTNIDNYLDVSLFDIPREHSFNYGKHYITINGYHNHIYTLDEFIFKSNKKTIIDFINWKMVDSKHKELLYEVMFDGKFGDLPQIEYDKQELQRRILQTDIYRLYYNKVVKQKTSLYDVFWNNMVSNAQSSNDIFPTMFEQLPVSTLEKIIPENEKEKIKMLTFYESDNPKLLSFYMNLSRIDTDEGKIAYITTVLNDLKETSELLLLPEIGDPKEFEKFENSNNYNYKLPKDYVVESLKILANALFEGYLSLSEPAKIKISKLNEFDIRNIDDIYWIIFEYSESTVNNVDYIGLTVKQIAVHLLLDLIVNERSAFISFSRAFRGTILKNIPRHPSYISNYHILIANLFKAQYKLHIELNELPASFQRFKIRGIKDDYIGSTTVLFPPILAIYYDMSNLDQEEIEAVDINRNNCDALLYHDINYAIDCFKDLKDDAELDDFYLKRKEFKSMLNFSTAKSAIVYQANIGKQATLCPIYIPDRKGYYVKKLRNHLFVYNLNNDIAKNLGLQPIKHNKYRQYYKKYISYYQEVHFDIAETMKKAVHIEQFNLDEIEIKKSKLIEKLSVATIESYDDNLFELMKKEFKLTEEQKDNLQNLINTKKSAAVKFITLKQQLKNISRPVEQHKIVEDFIKEFLDKQLIKIDLKKENTMIDNLSSLEGNKSKLVESLTTYKKEFKQMNSLLNKKYGDALTGQLTLSEGVKKHLISNIKILIKQLALAKMKNEAAELRLYLEILQSIKIGKTTSLSQSFDEDMRTVITNLTEKIDQESEESEPDEPEYKYEAFKFI